MLVDPGWLWDLGFYTSSLWVGVEAMRGRNDRSYLIILTGEIAVGRWSLYRCDGHANMAVSMSRCLREMLPGRILHLCKKPWTCSAESSARSGETSS